MTLLETNQVEYGVIFPIALNINLLVEAEKGLSTQEVLSRIDIQDVEEAGEELGGFSPRDIARDAVVSYENFKKQPNFGEIQVEEEPVYEAAN